MLQINTFKYEINFKYRQENSEIETLFNSNDSFRKNDILLCDLKTFLCIVVTLRKNIILHNDGFNY